MGVYHADGYSATVEGFLVVADRRMRLKKSNGEEVVLSEASEVPAGAVGELVVIVDGDEHRETVRLPEGATLESRIVRYEVAAPF